MFTERAPAQSGPLNRRWDWEAGQGGVAGPVRLWCGAGGFVAPEVTDLRTNVASAKKGVEGVHDVFLVAGTRVLLLVPRIMLRYSLIPDKPAPSLWLQKVDSHRLEAAQAAWALRSGAGVEGAVSATPAPRQPVCGPPGLCSKTSSFSLEFIFLFHLVTGTKVIGKSFVKATCGHEPGHFTQHL